jgi:gamma-glutamyltranspeptidase/glutathione hydrolase
MFRIPFLTTNFFFFLLFNIQYSHAVNQLPGTTYAGEEGAVATVNALATEVAAKHLQQGANAIDAAIAAALTLGIVDSYNSGIGGGLFALVHWAEGTIEAIDAREMAPALAKRDMYIRNGKVVSSLSREGALAIGVPGSVAALDYLSKKGGKRALADLYLEAAKIADEGFPISGEYAKRLTRHQDSLAKFPDTAKIFLDENNKAWPVGHRLFQKDLANTYRLLAEQGQDYFYRGEFAKKLETWMAINKGLVSIYDMSNYELKLRDPVASTFKEYTVLGFPPPSSGGSHVAQILNMVEKIGIDATTKDELSRHHLLAESMKLAFADRAYWMGDSDFVQVPMGLTDQAYADTLVKKLDKDKVIPVDSHHFPPDHNQRWFDKHTTHIATADKWGNWVAITTTLNTSFGSKVVIPGTGVLMNNQMDDFSAQPGVPNTYGLVGSEANSIQPRKRPLSSMSPTIVLKDGKPIMTIGAAGGPMIITQVTQGIINHLFLNKSLYESVNAPRVHHQWLPNTLFFDKTLPEILQKGLEAKGHKIKQLRFEGSTNAISIKSGKFEAISEPRLVERNR